MLRYTASEIEAKWQEAWEKAGIFTAQRKADQPKYYVLEMFLTLRGAFIWAMCATIRWVT